MFIKSVIKKLVISWSITGEQKLLIMLVALIVDGVVKTMAMKVSYPAWNEFVRISAMNIKYRGMYIRFCDVKAFASYVERSDLGWKNVCFEEKNYYK